MAILLFSVCDISCHASHALTSCIVVCDTQFLILSLIEIRNKVKRTENEI